MTFAGLEVIDGVFANGEDLIKHINGLDRWETSKVGVTAYQSPVRTSSTVFLPFMSYDNAPIVDAFARAVWQCLQNYSLIYQVPMHEYEPITFNRYEPGQHFAAHPDYFRGSDRCVSAVAYLNTVEDRGRTHFTYLNESVQPIAGRVVIFPSNFLFRHSGEAPVGTIKYSAAFWARG